MATYKEIKGVTVQTRSEDPTLNVGSWSSGGTRNEQAGAIGGTIIGTQTAAVAAGGNISGSVTNKTEEYNGTAWTAGNTLGAARRSLQAAGLESAGLVFGGDTSVNSTGFSNLTETYNGSTWSETTELTTARGAGSGAGLSTAAVAIGGSTGPGAPNYSNVVENWNGASWTNGTSAGTARIRGGAAGTQTSLLFFGGQAAPGASNNVELWNGSSWTETTEINTARGYAGSAGETSTAALFFGGSPDRAITESWDGTTWSEVADMGTGQSDNFGVVRGSNRSALSSGGESSPNAVSEEWSFPSGPHLNEGDVFLSSGTTLKGFGKAAGIPTGTWSSGPSMNYAREGGNSGFGTQTAGVAVAGNPSPGPDTAVEHFDGTSWTNATAVPAARGQGGSAGIQTAGIIMGGMPSDTGLCYTYNGSSWTEIAELNTGRNVGMPFGSSTSAIYAGGYIPPNNKSEAEEWNGSTWSEGSDLNDSRRQGSGGGSSSAAGFVVGGYGGSPSTNSNQTEVWNGTSFSEANELNTGRAYLTGGGEATLGITFGGGPISPGYTNKTETWNGTSWTEQSDMASVSETSFGTTSGASVGTYRASGRIAGSVSAATEEWNVDATLSTITVS